MCLKKSAKGSFKNNQAYESEAFYSKLMVIFIKQQQ